MQTLTSVNIRKRLLQLYQRLLEGIRGDVLVAQALQSRPMKAEKIVLLASGKDAASMARGAVQVLGERIVDARVITKAGHCDGLEEEMGIGCIEAGHPLPDKRSLEAGQALVDWLSRLPTDVSLLVLTSGGTSALVEALPAATPLEDLVRLNQWLLSSGLDIHAMNRIRQSVSCIKGGGLLACVPSTVAVEHLILSDVPGDDPAVIGSGLFVPTESEIEKAAPALPDWVLSMQQAAANCRTFHREPVLINQQIIASNTQACQQLATIAREMGMEVYLHAEALAGEALAQGQAIAQYLREQAEAGLHIWGGETTVVLPTKPGRGGRNQHLALAAAQELAGSVDITLLAVGTDGSDGPTEDAGAMVDGSTVRRGEDEGISVQCALQQADAGSFLDAAGELISTGITGTNVMDMVLAFKQGRVPDTAH